MSQICSQHGTSKAVLMYVLPMRLAFLLIAFVCSASASHAQESVDLPIYQPDFELNLPLHSPPLFDFDKPIFDAQDTSPFYMGEPSSQSSEKLQTLPKPNQPPQTTSSPTDTYVPNYSSHQAPGYTGDRQENTVHDEVPDGIEPRTESELERGIPPHEVLTFDISDLLSSESLPETYEQTLQRGNANEQLSLAERLIDEELTSENIRLALVLYKQVGEHKPVAYHKIGNLLKEHAALLNASTESAVTYWRRAAAKGYAPSMRSIGLAYRDGNIIKKNLRVAVEYLRRAHDFGSIRLGDEFALEREEAALAKLEANDILSRCAQLQHEPCPLVPVLYATNRLPQYNVSGATSFSGEVANSTYFGWSMWAIPEREDRSWFQEIRRYLEEAILGEQEVVPQHQATTELKEERFFALVRELLAVSKSKEGVVVYVHGYNNAFDDAASRAASFAYSMKLDGIPVIFSWPSLGKELGYFADEERLELSCAQFVSFLGSFRGS